MMRNLIVVVFALFAFPVLGADVITPSTRADYVLAKVREADAVCNAYTSFQTRFAIKQQVVKKPGQRAKKEIYVASRPVILCGFRESDQSWHTVEVTAASKLLSDGTREFEYTTIQSGYVAERVSGRGIVRMTFDLTDANGERITVYRYKHADIPDALIRARASHAVLMKKVEWRNYTPYHVNFKDAELLRRGQAFLRGEIMTAQKELRIAGVPSRAFPLKLLSDVFPTEVLMALGAIEQMDDDRFKEDATATTDAVYIEYALNTTETFKWSMSPAGAIGAFQFTNNKPNGTYDIVVRSCNSRGGDLVRDFETGAHTLRNAIKAAICLLDMELAILPEVHDAFAENPKLTAIYPVAAYNGGHRWADNLYQAIAKGQIDIASNESELPTSLQIQKKKQMHKMVGKGKHKTKKIYAVVVSTHNKETAWYVRKYISLINYLAELEVASR